MRVVVDTNVIISAAISKKSTSFLALELVIDFHKILISSPTFEELQGTLYQLKFERYFFPEDTRPGILETVLRYSSVVVPTVKVNICRHSKDNKFLELALAGKADCIITGDTDLLILHPFENIPIITPKEFLDKF